MPSNASGATSGPADQRTSGPADQRTSGQIMIVSDNRMRRLLPPFAIVLWLIAAYVHTLHGQIRSVHQIAPGVFTRIGDRDARQPANTSWIEFREFVVVIEANTPWGIRDILPEIRTTTSKPIRYVFDTHYHWDH